MNTATLAQGNIVVTPRPTDMSRVLDIPGAKRTGRGTPNVSVGLTMDNLRALRDMDILFDGPLKDAESKLARIENWLEREKRVVNPVPLKPPPLKPGVTLYKHQIRAYNMGIVLQAFAAFMDMGTGKTLTMIAVTGRRYLGGKVKRVLIVAPASVCPVWPAEYEKFADFPHRVAVLLGDRERRVRALNALNAPTPPGSVEPLRVAVINYESTWRLEDELREFAPDMIICDESQRIKGPRTSQSKAMHALARCAKYRVLLSGTPMQNDPRDFWSQYMFLSPTIFGTSYVSFERHYAIMGGPGNHMMLGPRNLGGLTRKVHSIAYRVTKTECLDLPEKMYETIDVELPPKVMEIYRRVQRDSYLQLEQGEVTASIVLVRLLRLQQLTGGFLTNDDGIVKAITTAKLDALADILQDAVKERGKKLVVFTRFIPELAAVKSLIEKQGIGHVSISGEVPLKDRGEIVRRFQADDATKVFVGQIDATAEGITLTAADTVVYYSVNWNLAKYQQSQDRIHRIGQSNKCTYLHLACPGTIDVKIMGALQRKEDMARSITDNWKQFFTEE